MNTSPVAVDNMPTRPSSSVRELILLCPDIHEVGGIGLLSRLTLQALQSYSKTTGCRGQVWSYHCPPKGKVGSQMSGWPALYGGGSKLKAALWSIKGGLSNARDTLVVTTHLHMAPLATPLIKRGAALAVCLCGIEAWVPLTENRAHALGRANQIIAISDYTTQRFRKANPRFADFPVETCLLGIPESGPLPEAATTSEPFALIVGRLSAAERYKGHDALLEVWPALTQVCPGARLMIAGDGDDRSRLETKAKELGVAAAVTFLGRVSDEKLAALYRDCNFFAMPSGEEGFGLVFLEAMRTAKACLAAQGAAEEIIENGVTGLIVPAGNRDALLAALIQLFQDPKQTAEMGRVGRQRYLRRFTQAAFEERLLSALNLQPRSENS